MSLIRGFVKRLMGSGDSSKEGDPHANGANKNPPNEPSNAAPRGLSGGERLTRRERVPAAGSSNDPVTVLTSPTVPTPVLLTTIKREREDVGRPALPIHRDPRQRRDVTLPAAEEDVSDLHPVETEYEIEVEQPNIKQEEGAESNSNWAEEFLRGNATTTPSPPPLVRVKQEPADDEDRLPPPSNDSSSQPPVDDDESSSDATVGLPEGEDESSDESQEADVSAKAQEEPVPQSSSAQRSFYSAAVDLDEEFQRVVPARAERNESHKIPDRYEESSSSDEDDVPLSVPNNVEPRAQEPVIQPCQMEDDVFGSIEASCFSEDEDSDDEGEFGGEPVSCCSPTPEVPELAQDRASAGGRKRPQIDPEEGSTVQPPRKSGRFTILTAEAGPEQDPQPGPSTSDGPPAAMSRVGMLVEDTLEAAERQNPSVDESSGTDVEMEPGSSRPKVKLTTRNRSSNFVTDFIKSEKSSAAPPPARKRPVTPTLKRKRTPSGGGSGVDSAPPSPDRLDFSGLDGNVALPSSSSTSSNAPPPSAAVVANPDLPLQTLVNHRATVAHRDPRLRAPPIRIPLSHKVKMDIMMRILKWHFSWIKEQSHLKEPPPLLQKVEESVPELECLPVCSRYQDVETYMRIFHPLLLHEMWSTLSLEYLDEGRRWRWNVHIKKMEEEAPGLALLQCVMVMDHEAEAPKPGDFVSFEFPRPDTGQSRPVFGHVESSRAYAVDKKCKLDGRLIPKGTPRMAADVVVRIRKNYASTSYVNSVYDMVRVANLTTFLNQLRVAAELGDPVTHMMRIILNPSPRGFDLVKYSATSHVALDPFQTEAMYSISHTIFMKPDESITLIHGPPGTGKTHVLMFMINHIVSHSRLGSRPRVLYCAPTDAAVDEAVRRLLAIRESLRPEDKFKVIRIGGTENQTPKVKDVTVGMLAKRFRSKGRNDPAGDGGATAISLANQIKRSQESINELEKEKAAIQTLLRNGHENDDEKTLLTPGRILELRKKLEGVEDDLSTWVSLLDEAKKAQAAELAREEESARTAVIVGADVICTTLDACCDPELEFVFNQRMSNNQNVPPARPFMCCIVDDASQCSEPQSLMPLILGMNKLVLVGDVEQPHNTLNSSVAKENKLNQSLFTRLYDYCTNSPDDLWRPSPDMEPVRPAFELKTQYRMNPAICSWPSKYYYGGKLATAETLVPPTEIYDYRVFDVRDGQETREGPHGRHLVNLQEAEVVVKLVVGILANENLIKKTIGVITFFRRQRNLIIRMIRERFPHDYKRVVVGTPEEFRGSEVDIVILSCVRVASKRGKKYAVLEDFSALTDQLNFALTRAVDALYICGHLRTLWADETLRELIRDAERRQVIHQVSSLFHPGLLSDIIHQPCIEIAALRL